MTVVPRFPASSPKHGRPILPNVRKPHCRYDPDVRLWVCGNYAGRAWSDSPVKAVTHFHDSFKWRWNWRRSRWVCIAKNRYSRHRGVMYYAERTQPKARKYRRG